MTTFEQKPVFVFDCADSADTMTVSRSKVTVSDGQLEKNAPDEVIFCIEGPDVNDKNEIRSLFQLTKDEVQNLIKALSILVED